MASSASKLSATAAEFVPKSGNVCLGIDQLTIGDSDVVSITLEAMMKLLRNPEEFFQVVNPLLECLSTSVKDSSMLDNVIEHILQQCICQENFQYIGARLCNSLAQSLKTNLGKGNFQDLLLKRCLAEYDHQIELLKNKGSHEVVGFTLFFAELMLSLKVGNENHVGVLGPNLAELLLAILSMPDDETITCVNKVLKLTGSALDAMPSTQERMTNIFGKIKECIISSVTSKRQRAILLNLVGLRAKKWETEDAAQTTQNGVGVESAVPSDTGIQEYHDENGQVVYEDYTGETEGYDCFGYSDYNYPGYISEECGGENYIPTDYKPQEELFAPEEETSGEIYTAGGLAFEIGPDEMDDEMDEAYEQFLAKLDPSQTTKSEQM